MEYWERACAQGWRPDLHSGCDIREGPSYHQRGNLGSSASDGDAFWEPRELPDLVRERYMEHRQVASGDPAQFEFQWEPSLCRNHQDQSAGGLRSPGVNGAEPSAFASLCE